MPVFRVNQITLLTGGIGDEMVKRNIVCRQIFKNQSVEFLYRIPMNPLAVYGDSQICSRSVFLYGGRIIQAVRVGFHYQ